MYFLTHPVIFFPPAKKKKGMHICSLLYLENSYIVSASLQQREEG